MQTATTARRSTSAKLRRCQIPPAFASATVSAATNGKGSKRDQRRRQSHAIKLADRGAFEELGWHCEKCGARDSWSYTQVDGAWLCEACVERHDSPDAGVTVPAPVSIVSADEAEAIEVEFYAQPAPRWAGLQTVEAQVEEQRIRRFLAGTRGEL